MCCRCDESRHDDVADTDYDLDYGDVLESSDEINDYDNSSMCMFTPLK